MGLTLADQVPLNSINISNLHESLRSIKGKLEISPIYSQGGTWALVVCLLWLMEVMSWWLKTIQRNENPNHVNNGTGIWQKMP